MDGKEKKKFLFVFVTVFLFALVVDFTNEKLKENNLLERGKMGEEEDLVVFQLNAEGILEDYKYEFVLEPTKVTKEEAEKFFAEVKREIDEAFSKYETQFPIKEAYASNLVEAEWQFTPSGYVDGDGVIIQNSIPDEGIVINVATTLTCGAYEEMYAFPVYIEKEKQSEQEILLDEIHRQIQTQMQQEGTTSIQLPDNVDGVELIWSEKKEPLTIKVLFLEITALVLILFLKRKEQRDLYEKRKNEMEYVYADVVSQLGLLLEAGMTMRQAWLRMAELYSKKKQQNFMEENQVYEALLHMKRRLLEGENEKSVYERFAEEIDIPCYRRLMRSLIGNLEKGNSGIREYLEEEEKRAYNEKILLAKKRGEEASTKMLVPLMLMMVLVMAVVIAPAMIGFFH